MQSRQRDLPQRPGKSRCSQFRERITILPISAAFVRYRLLTFELKCRRAAIAARADYKTSKVHRNLGTRPRVFNPAKTL